jgi:AAA-like domain
MIKLKQEVAFPIRHLEDNLVFGADGSVWAFYRLPMIDYTYRSPGEKAGMRNQWMKLFYKIEQEMHVIQIPRFFDIYAHQERLKDSVPDSVLKPFSHQYIDNITKALSAKQKYPTDQITYIGFRLHVLKAKATRNKLRKKFTFKMKDLRRYVESTAGIKPYEILDEEIAAYKQQEELLYQNVIGCVPQTQKATVTDFQFIIRHSVYRGIAQPEMIPQWHPKAERYETDGYQVIQPQPKYIENLIKAEYEVQADKICVRHYHDGQLREGLMRFLYMTYLPDDIQFPGEEWLHWLKLLSFPVDAFVRINVIPSEKAVEIISAYKRKTGHDLTHTQEDGGQQDLNLAENYQELIQEERNIVRERYPILETTIGFCIYASSKEELEERTNSLINLYKNRNKDMEVTVTIGDQFLAFHEFLPGSPRYITDFVHKLKPEMVANSMINASQRLGNSRGMLAGFTGPSQKSGRQLDQPVFIDQTRAVQGGSVIKTKSPSILICGLIGYGKSYAASLLMYQNILSSGAKVIMIDTKGERSNWVTDLPGLKGHVSLTRLGSDLKYRGMLDFFYLFDPEEAAMYAKDFLMTLVNVDRRELWHRFIQQAVQEVKSDPKPCMNRVLERIKELEEKQNTDGMSLYETLALYQNFSFSHLVFGDGNPPKHILSLDKPLNIIQIDEIEIPDQKKSPKDYGEAEILSKALMLPIAGFVEKFLKQDASVFKQVWWEECWLPLSIDRARQSMARGIRMGRSWKASQLLVTQNPTDIPSDWMQHIGMKLIFKTTDKDEIAKALEILEMEDNPTNRNLLKNLQEGECLFQDIYGRVGKMYIDCLFKQLYEAFDTTPPAMSKERG